MRAPVPDFQYPIIAIVGRPNVGKSSLFNRMLGKRAAVVDDIPGVTRDRNYRPFSVDGRPFLLVDTGGLLVREQETLDHAINVQIDRAIDEASAVLFVVDAGTGITSEDEHLARLLRRRAAARTILIVNKAESSRVQFELDAFRLLGLGDPRPVSALHGTGVADACDTAAALALKNARPSPAVPAAAAAGDGPLRVAVVGRPNAGKSSIVNRLLGENRMIVDNTPGTTRDSIDSAMTHRGRPVVLIDTAGLRKKSHVKQDLEYYFNLRAIRSIERCHVCVVVIDATDDIGVQDLRIIRSVIAQHRGLLLAWNKWDLVEKGEKKFERLVAQVKRDFLELRHVPMFATSALTGRRIGALLDEAERVRERLVARVPAAEFEDNVFTWVRAHPHPAIPREPVRFLGARQSEAPYPLFRFFVTWPKNVSKHYERFLANRIHDTYDFTGCPLSLDFRGVQRTGAKGPRVNASDKEPA